MRTIIAAVLLSTPGWAQEPPPAPPSAVPPAPAAAETARNRDQILYEKWRIERDGMVTVYYRVGHERGRLLKALLEGTSVPGPNPVAPPLVGADARGRVLSPKGWVTESEAMHLMVVCDLKEHIGLVEEVLKVLDLPDPQVVIDAKVVELRWDRDMEIGIEGDAGVGSQVWINNATSGGFLREVRSRFNPTEALTGGPFQGSTFRFARASDHDGTISGLVQAFVQRGRAEVLSNPRILVDSGDQAIVKAGEEIPFSETIIHPGGSTTTVKYKQTGITLTVKPHIVGAGSVHLDLNLDVGSVLGFINLPTGTAPSFTTRSAQTKVTVRDGEEIVLGGLRRKERRQLRRGIPYLSEIPVFGALFGRTEETESVQEILFFIKPTIIHGSREMPRGILDPARGK